MLIKFKPILLGGLALITLLINPSASASLDPSQTGLNKIEAAANHTSSAFTYQGQLTEDGSPANGTYDFRFILYDADVGGAQIGETVIVDDLLVDGGLFTTELDFANFFDGRAFWLEIAVRVGSTTGDYTILSPRQALTAAPYASSLIPGAKLTNPTGTALVIWDAYLGLWVRNTTVSALHISTAGGNGVWVENADSSGLYIGDAGNHGVLVENTENAGFRVESAGANGFYVVSAGNHGLDVGSAVNDGVHVSTANIGVDVAGDALAGYFFGDIQVTGNCTGCLMATFGINSGEKPLAPGDIVTVQGVQPSGTDSVPVLLEVSKASSGQGVVGVVQGKAELVSEEDPRPGEIGQRLIPRDGQVEPGEYVTIIIYGPVQVRAGETSGVIEPGAKLAVSEIGLARALQSVEIDGVRLAESAPAIGIALSAADENGLVWVLVNPQ